MTKEQHWHGWEAHTDQSQTCNKSDHNFFCVNTRRRLLSVAVCRNAVYASCFIIYSFICTAHGSYCWALIVVWISMWYFWISSFKCVWLEALESADDSGDSSVYYDCKVIHTPISQLIQACGTPAHLWILHVIWVAGMMYACHLSLRAAAVTGIQQKLLPVIITVLIFLHSPYAPLNERESQLDCHLALKGNPNCGP